MLQKTVSIIIPALNEEKTIAKILSKVINLKLPIKKEIICIDDGSGSVLDVCHDHPHPVLSFD